MPAGLVAGGVAGAAGVKLTPPAFVGAPAPCAGAVAGTGGCVKASSSTDFGVRSRVDASESTKARKRKIAPPHQLVRVSRFPAWRVPSSESAELLTPPKVAASPPPFPLWRSMAAISTRLSMTSRTRRNVNIPAGRVGDAKTGLNLKYDGSYVLQSRRRV